MKRTLALIALLPVCIAVALIFFAAAARMLEHKTFFEQGWTRDRVVKAYDAIPAITHQNGPFVLIVGSSDIEMGIDPIAIEKNLRAASHPERVYSFGFRSTGPAALLLAKQLAKRLNETRKADFILIKVTLPFLTLRAGHLGRLQALSTNLEASLYRWSDFKAEFFVNPFLSLEKLYERYALNGLKVRTVPFYLSESLIDKTEFAKSLYVGNPIAHLQDPIFLPSPSWDLEQRGNYDWNLPTSREAYNQFAKLSRENETEKGIFYYWENSFDARKLRLDPDRVAEFIESIKVLKTVSKKVAVMTFDDHPSLDRPAAAIERIQSLMRRISFEADVPIYNYSEGPDALTADDYLEMGHPNEQGRAKLAPKIAETIIQELP